MMKRKDREKDAAFALEVLRDCEYAVLATANPDGTPYCIPVSPALIGSSIYFHCAPEGRKIDNINNNNSVCITCAGRTKLIPEKFSIEYESAVAFGKCVIIAEEAEKVSALLAICEKYANNKLTEFETAINKSLRETCICRIDIETITGKANI